MKTLTTLFFMLAATLSLAAEQRIYKCYIHASIPGEVIITGTWTEDELGKAPAKDIKITTLRPWSIRKLLSIPAQLHKPLTIEKVSHDDGTTYLMDLTSETTPLGDFKISENFYGVHLTFYGPEQLIVETQQENGPFSFAAYNLECEQM